MIKENLRCEVCSSRPAKLVVIRRRREDECRTFLCEGCASERSRFFADANLDLDALFVRMDRKFAAHSCRGCGTVLADIVVDGRPGCCMCYVRFADEVERGVEKMQGRTYHVGKTPEK